ncbi:MAG: hypothetical protein KF822_00970 [Steroidobacteraceae bacterium]|nr:hypothetical protein [Steroidobacteraceae bacterium]
MNRNYFYAIVALAPLLCAATVAQGNFYGHYKDGVYTAPGKLFRVSSPFPDQPTVSDGREPKNNNAGAVSFIDQAGRLNGILYMENKGYTLPAGVGAEAAKPLGDWLRDTGFPGFFKVSLPGSKILRDEPGQIAGKPAWIAVAHLPKGSPLGYVERGSYDVQRNDSWRGIAVVAHGRHFYLLQTELRVEKLAAPGWNYDADSADWNTFLPELEALYHRIQFLKP